MSNMSELDIAMRESNGLLFVLTMPVRHMEFIADADYAWNYIKNLTTRGAEFYIENSNGEVIYDTLA